MIELKNTEVRFPTQWDGVDLIVTPRKLTTKFELLSGKTRINITCKINKLIEQEKMPFAFLGDFI